MFGSNSDDLLQREHGEGLDNLQASHHTSLSLGLSMHSESTMISNFVSLYIRR